MPNATSARRTQPVDASSAPAASRLGPIRMRALRQLNRVVQPLARRCYFMPQPKKRSLIGTKNVALASHVKAARVRSAAAAGASSSAQPIVEMDAAGAGARCIEMPHGHRSGSRTFAHARKTCRSQAVVVAPGRNAVANDESSAVNPSSASRTAPLGPVSKRSVPGLDSRLLNCQPLEGQALRRVISRAQ